MTLVQLQYVLAVAEFKNFTIAADKSFVTQPTLSMQIQKLEKELNIEIFDRTSHPIKITQIGEKNCGASKNNFNGSESYETFSKRRERFIRR
jgi:Transcriptional regulator